jgi:transcriptional regulator with XRE-family HTH domain
METLNAKLGQRIARYRKAIGLTQADLAEKVGVQPETICRIERGQRAVSLELIGLLSTSLDIELHDLFRLRKSDNPKDRAVERLLWFSARLSSEEIELLMDVGAAVLEHTRRNNRQ